MATAIPVIDLSEDTSSNVAPVKASFWQRAKSAVVSTAKRIAKPFVSVARKTNEVAKSAARTTVTSAKRAARWARAKARAAKSAVPSAASLWRVTRDSDSKLYKLGVWLDDTWTRVVKPFLNIRMAAFAIIGFIVGLATAPIATLLVVAGAGAFLFALSYGIEALEHSTKTAARWTLALLEGFVRCLKAAAYILTASLTLLLCAVSVPFLLTEVLELVLRYFDVANAVSISALVFFVLTGNWLLVGLEVAWLAYRKAPAPEVLRRRPEQQPVAASAGNRRVKLPKCTACGSDDDGPRLSLRRHKGLCSECFEALVEEDAIKAAKQGKITKKDLEVAIEAGAAPSDAIVAAVIEQPRSSYRSLSRVQVMDLSQAHLSAEDASKVYWAEVAWWHDDKGAPHVRKWVGFVAGQIAAQVEYNHRGQRDRYRAVAYVQNKRTVLGAFGTLTRAQEAVGDALSDEAALVGGMLDALHEEPRPATDASEDEAVVVSLPASEGKS